MTWNEVVASVAARTGASEAVARAVVRAVSEELRSALVAGQDVRMPGVGTFTARWVAGRVVRDVSTGRRRVLDGRYVARFTPGRVLRDALRDRTPQPMRDPEHQSAWRLAEALVGDLAVYHAAIAPRDLHEGDDPVDAERRLSRAFGEAWTNARDTWNDRIPPSVRNTCDHLLVVALRRFAADQAVG